MSARDVDLLLFGVTGFVGRLTAAHLLAHAPADLRIGLAGRSPQRVEAVRDELGGRAADCPVIVADSDDIASLEAVADRSRVVVSTVGPYSGRGLGLVGACAKAGTHYTDLTGEVLFVRDSIDSFDAVARSTGARIVHSCGADAVPSDLSVLATADAARAEGDGELTRVHAYWRVLKGGASGGTLASMAEDIRARKEDRRAAAVAGDPYALSPDRDDEPEPRGVRETARVGRAPSLPGWETPYLLSAYNAQVVRRSNAVDGYAYGRGLRYRETLATGTGPFAPVMAGAVAAAQSALMAGYATTYTRPLMNVLLPAPGEGPSEDAMRRGRFLLEVRAETTSGARWITRIGAAKDPGYGGTAVMLGEAAVALARGQGLPPRSGVLTPATGIGSALIDRLRAQGFTLTTERIRGRS